VTTEDLQLVLLLAGWLVAFLLGNELATGFSMWRTARAERAEQAAQPDQREARQEDVDRR
jgi:hypothetical protein